MYELLLTWKKKLLLYYVISTDSNAPPDEQSVFHPEVEFYDERGDPDNGDNADDDTDTSSVMSSSTRYAYIYSPV